MRLRVVAALEAGTVGSYRQAAEMFGGSERSVGSWWRAYQTGGRDALTMRKTRRSGPHELTGVEERVVLLQAMVDYTPERLLIDGPLWMLLLVAELIRMVTGW
ncbi:helix-turn-helix domain-containing protein [Streptomyces aureoversilis]|uniref:Helix-turn-helix domain-containing protein n=1 Tax=Streptomyces aureoversilis TaxID=67277 RepID=A0ABW0A8E3_9ACTN